MTSKPDDNPAQPTDLPFRAAAGGPLSTHLISGARVTRVGDRDVLELWSRGVLMGPPLTVAAGDGLNIVYKLGLAPRMS